MDGMTWVLLAIVALAAGAIAFLRLKGHLTGDAAARAIGAVVELARQGRGRSGAGTRAPGRRSAPGCSSSSPRSATRSTRPRPAR